MSFLVSFVLSSSIADLGDIGSVVKVRAARGSRNRGEKSFRGETWDETDFRIESGAKKSASLDVHFSRLMKKLPASSVTDLRKAVKDVRIVCHVAYIYTTYTATVRIKPSQVAALEKRGCGLEVSTYPGM